MLAALELVAPQERASIRQGMRSTAQRAAQNEGMGITSIGSARAWQGRRLIVMLACGTLLARLDAGLPAPWRFAVPQPQGNDLLAAWSPAPDELYAGGHGGVIMHWDGAKWTVQATPTQKTIFAIHGLSPSAIWAVGGDPYTDNITNRCLILRYDGASWKEMPAPQFSDYTYPFNAVHAVAANDVWASHDYGTSLAHYDGTKWDWVYPPLAVEGSFKAITSAGANHLFVAGTHGQILHRDNGTWKLEQKRESGSMSFSIITKLWAYDANNVFAAGNWTQFCRRNSDGTWAQLPVNTSEPFGIGFCALWGRSPTEVYLLNENSVFYYDGTHPVVQRDFKTSIRRQWLNGAGSGDRLYGVGPGGVAHEYKLDGPGSGTVSALTVGGNLELSMLYPGLASCGTNGVIVFGFAYDDPNWWPLSYVANGVAQKFPSLPPGAVRPTHVKAVIATGLGDVIVAWENVQDWARGVHRWDGVQWRAMSGAEGTVAFWRSPSGRLHAAGPTRVLYWKDPDGWQTLYTVPDGQPETRINALWGRADNEVFAGTVNGRILRYNGSTWSPETTPGAGVIVGLAGTASDTYAVGEDGLVWRRSGTTWQKLSGIAANAGEHFTAVAVGSNGVYAAQRTPSQYIGGGLGRLWRFSGSNASLVIQGLSQPLDGLARTGADYLVGLASRDFVITDAPETAAPVLQRVDLALAGWQPVGDTGVAVRSGVSDASRPVMSAQRISNPAPFGPNPAPYAEHWILLEDKFYAGTAIPQMYIRVQYDPAKLAADLSAKPLDLFRYTDSAAEEIPSVHDPAARTLSSVSPVDFSIWSVGAMVPPPELRAARVAAHRLVLSWPATATGYVLESAPALSPSAAWAAGPELVQVVGSEFVVAVDATDSQRFFRLRKSSY